MSRSKRSAQLETKTKRLELGAGMDHTETLSSGRYLLYRRPASGRNGTWRARWRNPENGKFLSKRLGAADDFTDADGIDVIDWKSVQKKAEVFFTECARTAQLEAIGEAVVDSAYTVGHALRDHITEGIRLGQETATLIARINAIILPEFGEVPVAKLTTKKIEDWRDKMGDSPRRKTGWGVSEARTDWGDVTPTDEQLRARKATANRNLATLRKALSFAVEKHRVSRDHQPWKAVLSFQKVSKSRARFLKVAEQRALVKGCSDDFRPMVQAALFTGSRYGPLCRLKVRDFDPIAETIWISKDKWDSSRYVHLAPEAVAWFKKVTKGRGGDESMFLRKDVKRVNRLNLEGAWARGDQDWQMVLACRASKVEPLVFHILRHTYASGLVNAGVPLVFVAKQLGHVDTRMVEHFYGHLCPSALKESVRVLSPVLGIAGSRNRPATRKGFDPNEENDSQVRRKRIAKK